MEISAIGTVAVKTGHRICYQSIEKHLQYSKWRYSPQILVLSKYKRYENDKIYILSDSQAVILGLSSKIFISNLIENTFWPSETSH